MTLCAILGCTRSRRGDFEGTGHRRGGSLCEAHRMRARHERYAREHRPCAVARCARAAISSTFCPMHQYRRGRGLGDCDVWGCERLPKRDGLCRLHAPVDVPLATCDRCGSIYVRTARRRVHCLKPHVLVPTGHGPLPHRCEVCETPFESPMPHARYCSYTCQRKARRHAPGEHERRRRADKVKRLRPLVIARWGMRCYLCGGAIERGPETVHPGALTLDHVVPIAQGGRDEIDNLRPAHRACNEDKGERYPTWWERERAGMVAA